MNIVHEPRARRQGSSTRTANPDDFNAELVGADAYERSLEQQIRAAVADLLACATRAGQLRYARLLPDLISSSSADEVAPLRAGPDR
jgi:hypothetical protein